MNDETTRALVAAVKGCEDRSAAEIVIAVRARSASYLHADLLAGAIASAATLAFLLYSPITFPLWSFLIDTVLVGGVAGFATSRVPELRRLLTTPAARRACVRRAAHATFFERGVGETTGRTGILVYVGLTERCAEVVVDRGVAAAVDPAELAKAIAAIDGAVSREGVGPALVRAIEAMGAMLGASLPRRAEDVNELPDEVSEG